MLQFEQYGFDEEINVILQPRGKFIDPDAKLGSQVIKNVRFSNILFVPAEMDILVTYAPLRVLPETPTKESYMGRFRMRAWYQQFVLDSHKKDKRVTVIVRPGQKVKKPSK